MRSLLWGPLLGALGAWGLRVSRNIGGASLLAVAIVMRLLPPRFDREEFWQAMHRFGIASLPIAIATAIFTGAVMVLLAATHVQRYGTYDLVGWYSGFTTFREVAPLMVALMISGRVGASNTAELAAMRATDQMSAMQLLALDVTTLLIVPRAAALLVSMLCLVAMADLTSVLAGGAIAYAVLDLSPDAFWQSLRVGLAPLDLYIGLAKAALYAIVIAAVSGHFGLSAEPNAGGVGRAVHAQVMTCAVAFFVIDLGASL
jgi:phospholipid/cholesterol/gamma-HCH transport system permease protein